MVEVLAVRGSGSKRIDCIGAVVRSMAVWLTAVIAVIESLKLRQYAECARETEEGGGVGPRREAEYTIFPANNIARLPGVEMAVDEEGDVLGRVIIVEIRLETRGTLLLRALIVAGDEFSQTVDLEEQRRGELFPDAGVVG